MTANLNNLIPTSAVDVTGVYDINFNQVFSGGRPVKATINDSATFFKQPLENSTSRTDHIIFNPVEITLSLILSGSDYRRIYFEINQIYRGQQQLIVQTRTNSYENMYIQAIPQEESPDIYDAIIINLQLVETLFSNTVVTFQPANEIDRNTSARGQQEPMEATESQQNKGSALYRIFS